MTGLFGTNGRLVVSELGITTYFIRDFFPLIRELLRSLICREVSGEVVSKNRIQFHLYVSLVLWNTQISYYIRATKALLESTQIIFGCRLAKACFNPGV